MSSKSTPEDLMRSVSAATRQAESKRHEAREAVVPAIRAMETELIRQLDGGKLRGLKNLGIGAQPFYAARIRGKPDTKILWPDEADSYASTLVVVPSGHVVMAICETDSNGEIDPVITIRQVRPDEWRAEDLQGLLTTLRDVIPRHVEYAERAAERYAGLHELSENVLKLLGEGK